MRAVYVLVLVALCAQQALGFKMHSFDVELSDDVEKDILDALDLSEKDIDRQDIDKEDIDREDIDREDIDKEDIDKEYIDKEDIDRDGDSEETDEEDVDEAETEVEGSHGLGRSCKKRFRRCRKSRDCCGHLVCLRYKFIKACI